MHWAAACSLVRRSVLPSPLAAFGLLLPVSVVALALPPRVGMPGDDGCRSQPVVAHTPTLSTAAATATSLRFTMDPVYRPGGDISATRDVGRMSSRLAHNGRHAGAGGRGPRDAGGPDRRGPEGRGNGRRRRPRRRGGARRCARNRV